MSSAPHDHVVVVTNERGRVAPYGPARPKADAEDVARRLRSWGMNATALPGRVEGGKFMAWAILA